MSQTRAAPAIIVAVDGRAHGWDALQWAAAEAAATEQPQGERGQPGGGVGPAAKRARYAVELAAPAYPAKRAKKIIKRYKRRQDQLGEHQDAITAAQLLRDHAARVDTPPPFTYGLLLAREDGVAQRTREHAANQ